MTVKQLVKLADMMSEQKTDDYDIEDIYEALELAERLEKTAELYKIAAEMTYDAVAEAVNPNQLRRKAWPWFVAGGTAGAIGTALAVPQSRKAIFDLLSKVKTKIAPKIKIPKIKI